MTAAIRFELLGPVNMWAGEFQVPLGAPQQRALLAMLLLRQGKRLSLEEIAWALWGEDTPRGGLATIRTYVSRLRQVLSDLSDNGVAELDIHTEPDGYRMMVEPSWIDLHLFRLGVASARRARAVGRPCEAARRLAEALTLWRGAPLSGLGQVKGLFFTHQRALIEELLADATEERLAVDIEIGHCSDAAAELHTAVIESPYRERLWELLMLALYRLSRQAEALATYREVSHRLSEELGVRPGPGLQQIHARILASDPDLLTQLPSAV